MNPEDKLEPKVPQPETDQRKLKTLEEKDFIYEAKGNDPLPPWFFIIIVLGIFSIIWLGGNWFLQTMETKVDENPFLQVTNREMSLFLWQKGKREGTLSEGHLILSHMISEED